MKEAHPITEAGALAVEGAQAVRAGTSAAPGGDRANTYDASTSLAPEEADRFAMAFRPSWEPLAADPAAPVNTRSRAPSVGPRVSSHPPAHPQDVIAAQDELLRLRGRSARKRSFALAAVSVLSFVSLVYWGISSTTSGTELPAAKRSLPPPQAAEPATGATAVQPPAASQPEQTGLTARLADPAQAAANAQAPVQPEGDTQALPTENASGDGAQQAAAAESEPTQQAEQAKTEQAVAPVVPLAPAVRADSATSIQPATAAETPTAKPEPAAAPVQPAHALPEHAPAIVAKPAAAVAVAPAPEAKPSVEATRPALAAAPAALAKTAASASSPAPVAKPAVPDSSPATSTKSPEPTPARPPLLVVRAVPDSAQLTLDGQTMSNPFDTRLPLGSKHKIEARQEGYEASSQTIRIESDARLTITLRRATPAPAPHIKVQPLPEGARGAGFVTANPY